MPPTDLTRAVRQLRRRAYERVALHLTSGEPLVPPRRLHTVGDSDFRSTGDEFLELFRELVGLRTDERVLDVGCGIGRIARPLAGYLTSAGSYDGFDVADIAIKWCQRHYARRHPNFTFKHVNVANDSYNPGGPTAADSFSFPYATSSFDFVFLTSVFTHMMPAGVERYMEEISRVLAPGGRCLLTFFLLNDESRQLIDAERSSQRFRVGSGPYAVVDSTHPEDAVAYEEQWVLSHLSRTGLSTRLPVRYGSWCGRELFTSYQDIIIADRSPSPAG